MLSQKDLAAALQLTDRHVRRLAKDGMPAVGEGRRAVYDLSAVCAWLARTGRTAPGLAACVASLRPPDAQAASASTPAPQAASASTLVPAAAAPPPPAPDGDGERGHAVSSRRTAWDAAAAAIVDVAGRIRTRRLEPTPQQAESLARTARMLTEAVRGEAIDAGPRSPRDLLVEALRAWRSQWGDEGLDELLVEARG